MRNEKAHIGAKNMPTVTTELLTRRQVAALFQVSTLTVIRLEAAGKLPAVRIGTSIRYRRSDVETYISEAITKGKA
jgi:excisionase family DNA binding protein